MMYATQNKEYPLVRDIAELERGVEQGEYTVGDDVYAEKVDSIVQTAEEEYDDVYAEVVRRLLNPEHGDPMFDAAASDATMQYEITQTVGEVEA